MTKPRWITAKPETYLLIREYLSHLRENETQAERILWESLRNKQTGYKIRRQHIIDHYIADFVCIKKRLIIEVDGKIHLKRKQEDELRTLTLNQSGWKVIRFTNEEVINNTKGVTNKIKEELDKREDWNS